MQVQAIPLSPGLSVTLVNEAGMWRFSSWTADLQPLPPPAAAERAKLFRTAEDAASHFRALCARVGDV